MINECNIELTVMTFSKSSN